MLLRLILRLWFLLRLRLILRLRLSGVWFAALFAATVRSNYSDAGTIAAKFSAGKIYGPPSVILSSQLRVFADLRSPCLFFATPAAVTALFGKRSVAGRTSQLTQQFSTMWAFQFNAP